ncbi:MAG: trypsin-like serine protease [Woeseiaceae bacterium]|nr:trypsin-like serine protease [Woeseiaceae bacterium]
MKSLKKLIGFMLAVAILTAGPATAVTDGELDGEGHPHVGLLIFDFNGSPAWRCSGTLLSPTVLLTAGHCTDGATGGRVWFDADEATILSKGYPFGGGGAIEFSFIDTHPLYPTAPFFVNDVGIAILSEPVYLDEYGVLPEVDQLDQLKTRRGTQNQMFTAVGYGLQRINPVFVEAERTRMVAYPHLIQINVPGFTGDFSLLLSNNHSTGGTCFGDSGGPNFIGNSNVVGGVTSFGINGNCAGTGGVFRMDRQNVLDFVNNYLNP